MCVRVCVRASVGVSVCVRMRARARVCLFPRARNFRKMFVLSITQKNSGAYIESMGTLFNCCRHPEVVRMLRQKPVLQDVLAFVDKDKFGTFRQVVTADSSTRSITDITSER